MKSSVGIAVHIYNEYWIEDYVLLVCANAPKTQRDSLKTPQR